MSVGGREEGSVDTKHMETYQLYTAPIIIIGVPVGSYHHENYTLKAVLAN